ncbi:MAG TPA: glycosyltransferase family 88 protein [Parachlamydiaceae bacterium]|nr:glycosyltransferase family 88 protein [Parachlamydiaceae bacterium]
MLPFREAASKNNLSGLERLWSERGSDFNIDEPGPQSGKTAAHVAAERGCFKAIYWLFKKGANFYCKDNTGSTPVDYLQQKEFKSISSSPMSKEERKYCLCNAHYKIWLAHDPKIFMPYLYQDDFRQYREKNPEGYLSLVYSAALLSDKALSDLTAFAEKYQITLISFENDLANLTDQFGTIEDKQCYELASKELGFYPNSQGGNLAVVSDLIRWSSVLLRKGSYSDTDVEIGQHQWSGSITIEKACALNLGSLIYSNGFTTPWLNGDIIAGASLFPKAHPQGNFRITLSKTACFMIKKVQSSLIVNCRQNMMERIKMQEFVIKIMSDLSTFLQIFFNSNDPCIVSHFSSDEIQSIKAAGLNSFSQDQKTFIIEKMANLMRKRVEEEYETADMAHQYSKLFQNTKNDEHEKFLVHYMQAMQRGNIKEAVKKLTGSPLFSQPIWTFIQNDDWEKYSIYANTQTESAFRSTNTVRFNMHEAENKRIEQTQKCADLSFTSLGMADVLKRSETLKKKHDKS